MATPLVDFLLDYYLGATLLLAAALFARRLFQQPSARLAVAWAATGALLLLVGLAAVPDSLRISLRPQAVTPESKAFAAQPGLSPSDAMLAGSNHSQPNPPQTMPSAARLPAASQSTRHAEPPAVVPVAATSGLLARLPPWRNGFLAVYLCGAAGVLLWQILGYVELQRVCRRAQPADSRVRSLLQHVAGENTAGHGGVALLVVESLPSAAAVGLVRPRILLPGWLTAQANDDQLRALLAHEWTHLRNRDLWLLAGHRVLLVLLYAHPLHWLLRRVIRDDQELVADAAAADLLARGEYAELLLRWSSSSTPQRGPRLAMSAGLWERPSGLARRITALVDERMVPIVACSRRWRWAAAAGFSVLALTLSAFTLRSSIVIAAAPPTGTSAPVDSHAEQPRSQEQAAAPGAKDYLVTGRVLGPDGQPHAGAKLYAVLDSTQRREPVLKDPAQPPFEVIERKGQPPLLKVKHPEVVALLKKLGHDSTVAADDPIVRSPEFERGMADLMPKIYASHPLMPPQVRATSAADGTFRFTLGHAEAPGPFGITVVAQAPPLAPAWSEKGSLANLALQLAEDTPIHGRIVAESGKPVAGASVRMGSVMGSPEGTIDFWNHMLDAYLGKLDLRVPQRTYNELHNTAFTYQFPYSPLLLYPQNYTTDADGRFTITGVGKNRVVFNLQVSAPQEGSDAFSVAAAPEVTPTVRDPRWALLRPAYRTYPANFEHRLRSEQIIEGTVTDAEGQPVPNVQVDCWSPTNVWTLTDERGKYRLKGLSRADRFRVQAWPWGRGHQPYLNMTQTVDGNQPEGPLTVDFKLIRGVVLRGQITNAEGRPFSGAAVHYASLDPAAHLSDTYYPENPKFPPVAGVAAPPPGVPYFAQAHAQVEEDGSYEMVILPGPGVLGIYAGDRFAVAPELLDDPELKKYAGSVPSFGGWNFNAIAPLDVPAGAEFRKDLALDLKLKPDFKKD